MEYLKTQTAANDYVEMLFKATNGLKQSIDKDLLHEMWTDKLQDKGVVTEAVNEDDVLPAKIIGDITNNLRENVVLSKFTITKNVQAGQIFFDQTTEGAWGHKTLADKKEQTAVLAPRAFFPKAIYKLQALDHMTYLSGGALVAYILKELADHVAQAIAQEILVGGIKNEDGTDFTAIYPIMTDDLATQVAAQDIFSGVIDGIAAVDGDSSKRFIFINPSDYATLLKAGDNLAIALLTGTVNIGATFVPTDIIPAAAKGVSKFLVVNTSDFLLGMMGSGMETLTDFEIRKNGQVIESRAYVAGSLTKANAAAVVTVGTPSGE